LQEADIRLTDRQCPSYETILLLAEYHAEALSITHKYGTPEPVLTEQIRSQASQFAEWPGEQRTAVMEATEKRPIESESCGGQDWIEQELAASTLPDARLEKRRRHLLEQLAKGVERSIPWACEDWAAAKAAYRFFSNDRVHEEQILAGHFLRTRERIPCTEELLLVVHLRPSSVTSARIWPRWDWSAKARCARMHKAGAPTDRSSSVGWKAGRYTSPPADQPALQFGPDSGRAAAGVDRRQVLEPQGIQRPEGEREGA
jgi:hypothetical protein